MHFIHAPSIITEKIINKASQIALNYYLIFYLIKYMDTFKFSVIIGPEGEKLERGSLFMNQKLYQIKLLLFVMAFLSVSLGLFPIKALAEDNSRTVYCIESTKNSITIDFSKAAENVLREQREKWPKCYMEKFQLTCRIPNTPGNIAGPGFGGVTLSGSKGQYTFKELKPETQYHITVTYYINYKPGSQQRLSSTFYCDYCTAKTQPLKVLGTSGTTATIDFRDYLKNIKTELAANNVYSELYLGYADQSIGKDPAIKKAKDMAGRQKINLYDTHGNYMLSGLTPGHTYAIVIYAMYHTRVDYSDIYSMRYYQATDVKTGNVDDSDLFAEDNSFVPIDSESKDEVIYGKTLYDAGSINNIFMLSRTSTNDSITIDWSKQQSETKEIIPAKKRTNIEVSCVESENFDPDADMRQYGRKYNFGPNVRNAVKKVEASPIKVKNGEKSYTFKGLKKDTAYTVIVKCGLKDTNKTEDTVYGYVNVIFTNEKKSTYSKKMSILTKANKAYMYDIDLKRDGSAVYLDWTSALDEFFSQTLLEDCVPGISLTTGGLSGINRYSIGYAELPDSNDEKAIEDSYKAAENMAKNYNKYESLTIPDNYSRYRIYGLDPDKQYVFAIHFNPDIYYYGEDVSSNPQCFFADERGMNYYKAKKLNANKPGDSSKPTQPKEQDKQEEETKSKEETKPREEEKTQKQTGATESEKSQVDNQSKVTEKTENAPSAVNTSGNKATNEPVNGKKADKA